MLDPKTIDFDALRAKAERVDADDMFDYDPDPDVVAYDVQYLGSILYLSPSGKVYAPWACSHVSEEEANADEEWVEDLERAASDAGAHVAWGLLGDGLNVHIVWPVMADDDGGAT